MDGRTQNMRGGRHGPDDEGRKDTECLRRSVVPAFQLPFFLPIVGIVLVVGWLQACSLTTTGPLTPFPSATTTASPSVPPVAQQPTVTPTPTPTITPSATPSATATLTVTATPRRPRPTATIADVPSGRTHHGRPTRPLASATPIPAASETTPPPAPPAESATAPAIAGGATPRPPTSPRAPPDAIAATLEEQRGILNPAADYDIPWDRLPQYSLAATLQPPDVIGQMTLRFPNTTGTALDALVFRLFPNGRPIYAGRMRVSDVTIGGEAVTPSPEANETALRVPLPTPLAENEAVTVTLRFTTTVGAPGAGYGILNQGNGVITLGGWFPLLARYEGGWQVPAVPTVGDAVSSDTSLFTVELRAPADLQIASTGEVVASQKDGELTHWRLVSGPARDFALVGSYAWSPISAEVDGIEVRYFAAPGTTNAPVSPQQGLQLTLEAVRTYSQTFGPYPYRQLDVVEAEVPIGGYEYPGLVLFDSRHRINDDLNLVRYLLTHEVAHQWFYSLVGNNVTAEPWLDESLATFATLLGTEITQGKGAAEARRAQWAEEYASVLAQRPVGVNQPVYAFHSWREYRGPVYYAGALMLDDLRRELGDERFLAALRAYVKRFAFRHATGSDFRATFEEVADRDLGPFFQRWFVPGD